MNTQNLAALAHSNDMVMSSVEIAELTGKRHNNVVRDIENMLETLGLGLLTFEHTYVHEQNHQSYRCFKLPKDLCLTLITGYKVDLRHAIVVRWEERKTSLST
ncbi:Rha family transcriptional regulator [Citrobacter freundii]|uniref:Rha family transcriptional regulator n=1 Tax=Citrobacter portucalensis TaxID=1639133 RepID=UPI0015E94220|nr:Rha family transcriptional regulator [Citrobacter freundii]